MFIQVLLLLTLTIPASREPKAAMQQNPQAQATPNRTDGPLTNAVSQGSLGPIDPYVVAGGGGTSSGNSFALDGTIGQQAAGPLGGGTFTIAGGFWPSVAGVSAPKKRRGQLTSQ